MSDKGLSLDDETLPICDNCEEYFDDENEGHTDEATDLSFCAPACEMNYDREIGLPEDYETP